MKKESVLFKQSVEDSHEDQVFLEIPNEKNHFFGETETDATKYTARPKKKNHKRKIQIIRIIAVVCFVILLAVVGLVVYWSLSHELDKTEPQEVTTAGQQPTDTSPTIVQTTSGGVETTVSDQHTTFPSSTTALKPTTMTMESSTSVYDKRPTTYTTKPIPTTYTTKPIPTTYTTKPIPTTYTTKPIPTTYTTKSITTTTTIPDPIVFVSGRFNFSQAIEACDDMGRVLAVNNDLDKAFAAGYERCQYGWLLNRHTGYVMQASGARQACGGGIIGPIYSKLRNPSAIVGGAYCAPKRVDLSDTYNNVTGNKSVNWWVTMDPADIYNLRYLLSFAWKKTAGGSEGSDNLLGSLHAVYPCCSFLNITMAPRAKTTTVKQRIPLREMKYLVETYKKEFGNPDLQVYPHVLASYEAMIEHGAATTNRSLTLDAIVDKAVSSGVDGLIIDYEPSKNYTREHAEIYRDFLNELIEKLDKHDIKVAMLVSSWGILKFYDVYSSTRCSIIGSMASTYYGHNITRNMAHVREMLNWIDTDRLQIGIGAMHMEDHVTSARSYNWNARQLQLFTDWLKKQGIEHLHMYPSQWGGTRWVERYFVNSLLDFVQE